MHAHGAQAAPSAPGSVVVDIGGGRGAAVIFTGADLDGAEIEIREGGSAWDGTHVGVRERLLGGGSCWAALFGPLSEGDYEARLKDRPGSFVLTFSVVGGKVTKAGWPTP